MSISMIIHHLHRIPNLSLIEIVHRDYEQIVTDMELKNPLHHRVRY